MMLPAPITQTCYCRCGRHYRSNGEIDLETCDLVANLPCPGCGRKDQLIRIDSDLSSPLNIRDYGFTDKDHP